MNCQIADGAITPSFDQLSVDDDTLLISTTYDESATQENDSMIPLARLPGFWFFRLSLDGYQV